MKRFVTAHKKNKPFELYSFQSMIVFSHLIFIFTEFFTSAWQKVLRSRRVDRDEPVLCRTVSANLCYEDELVEDEPVESESVKSESCDEEQR